MALELVLTLVLPPAVFSSEAALDSPARRCGTPRKCCCMTQAAASSSVFCWEAMASSRTRSRFASWSSFSRYLDCSTTAALSRRTTAALSQRT